MSSTCPHNMVNFGLLAAEIGWPVWGTPANFNWFCVLAALLHYCTASSSGLQPNFAALNRGRHLYSAGRPSRWALAHISSTLCLHLQMHKTNQSWHFQDSIHNMHTIQIYLRCNSGNKPVEMQ